MSLTNSINPFKKLSAVACIVALSACGASYSQQPTTSQNIKAASLSKISSKISADRTAILAMAGDYKVTFDFKETVSFKPNYTPTKEYVTGAHEIVRVIENTDTFISLQHILVVGDGNETPYTPIKHWRQDWAYEPTNILNFVGANTWENKTLTAQESAGKWAQTVYQVDDAPRYAALATWTHKNGMSSWTSPSTWRPLPRRDATKRNDYHVISAKNRHAITPTGWVHEQDNAKLILTGEAPEVLVHETGVNTYIHSNGFDTEAATEYWDKTKSFWQEIRTEWDTLIATHDQVALSVLGEPSEIYMPILSIATDVEEGKTTPQEAAKEAIELLHEYILLNPAPAHTRLIKQLAENRQ